MSQEFYKDIVKTTTDLTKEVKNIKKEDVISSTIVRFDSFAEFAERYYEKHNDGELTITEETAIDLLTNVVVNVGTDLKLHYSNSSHPFPSDGTVEIVDTLSDLLGIEIKISDLNIK